MNWFKKIFSKKSVIHGNKPQISTSPNWTPDHQDTEHEIIEMLQEIGLSDSEITELLKDVDEDNIAKIRKRMDLIERTNIRSKTHNSGSSSSPISDSRYKKNITSISNPLNKLTLLQGVTFEWRFEEFKKMGFDNKRHIGLIAQDVEKIIPETVFNNKDGYKYIDYNGLIGLLVEAIKEQQAEINELKNKLS